MPEDVKQVEEKTLHLRSPSGWENWFGSVRIKAEARGIWSFIDPDPTFELSPAEDRGQRDPHRQVVRPVFRELAAPELPPPPPSFQGMPAEEESAARWRHDREVDIFHARIASYNRHREDMAQMADYIVETAASYYECFGGAKTPREMLQRLRRHLADLGPSALDPAIQINLHDQSFSGPTNAKAPYSSLCILSPSITIERHRDEIHIAARFNMETTILRYDGNKSDGNELFFSDVRLQYMNRPSRETLVMWPESDASGSFQITRNTSTEVKGDAGVSLSQAPSGNVSIGLSRSTELSVEYSVGTWSVSAHQVVHEGQPGGRAPSTADDKSPVYQWFWAGTHNETKRLSPDLKYTVSRHVVAKRVVSLGQLLFDRIPREPVDRAAPEARARDARSRSRRSSRLSASHDVQDDAQRRRLPDADSHVAWLWYRGQAGLVTTRYLRRLFHHYLSFSFEAQVSPYPCSFNAALPDLTFEVKMRVKRRYGRFHRAILLSGNEVKSSFLKPSFDVHFDLKPDPGWIAQFVASGLGVLRSPVPLPIGSAGPMAAGAAGAMHRNVRVARKRRAHANVRAGSPTWPDADFEAGDSDVDSSTAGEEYYDPADETRRREWMVAQGAVPRRKNLEAMLDERGTFRVDAPPEPPPLIYRFPLGQTEDISAVLHEVKAKNAGDLSRLQGASLSAGGLSTTYRPHSVATLGDLEHARTERTRPPGRIPPPPPPPPGLRMHMPSRSTRAGPGYMAPPSPPPGPGYMAPHSPPPGLRMFAPPPRSARAWPEYMAPPVPPPTVRRRRTDVAPPPTVLRHRTYRHEDDDGDTDDDRRHADYGPGLVIRRAERTGGGGGGGHDHDDYDDDEILLERALDTSMRAAPQRRAVVVPGTYRRERAGHAPPPDMRPRLGVEETPRRRLHDPTLSSRAGGGGGERPLRAAQARVEDEDDDEVGEEDDGEVVVTQSSRRQRQHRPVHRDDAVGTVYSSPAAGGRAAQASSPPASPPRRLRQETETEERDGHGDGHGSDDGRGGQAEEEGEMSSRRM